MRWEGRRYDELGIQIAGLDYITRLIYQQGRNFLTYVAIILNYYPNEIIVRIINRITYIYLGFPLTPQINLTRTEAGNKA